MNEETGLRERKKQRTRETLSRTAIELFLERGFDQVSVAEVAAAAEVSKPTLFRYFPAKEDLVLHGIADHQGEAARVVRGRAPGERALAALRAHFHERLDAHDPITGLCDIPAVVAYRELLYGTPSLRARLTLYSLEDERELAAALGEAAPEGVDGLVARLAAAQIVTVHQALARVNWERLAEGASAVATLGAAHADADAAYELLGSGLGVRGL
ncbi:TetR family transcriptional regulator [Streptomyces eurocidicus]|uniref:AcrR family transcriptional regulator n=1 Tax=Streptomyces eurocidicus TaxID=66423 RepID=A0A2N8NNZ0_STREU|nr:TetR family transcriptional regulator [Streptomyces eurocidicus]MBB5116774.1 AcrR family transcriptional regulator [Streptomyces eurocidicus]MBF6052224.1 TetR family transcriptional regulator [Streptomyces eurocidicus]PNE30482.1 TetR family transcriptional regulator [Streptomyces eurocidicus]